MRCMRFYENHESHVGLHYTPPRLSVMNKTHLEDLMLVPLFVCLMLTSKQL